MNWRGAIAAGLLLLAGSAAANTPLPATAKSPPTIVPPAADKPIAVLQGLDKTTARVSTFEAAAGTTVHFGTLSITVRDCRKHPPEEDPESAAYLDIDEVHPGQTQPVHWFSGWMFASSPAVSALEHPVYDVWVLDCKTGIGSNTVTP